MGWFSDSSDSENDSTPKKAQHALSKNSDEDSVDPLDAFMSGITATVATEAATCLSRIESPEKEDGNRPTKRIKSVRLDVEGEEEATAHWVEPVLGSHEEESGYRSFGGASSREAEVAAKSLANTFHGASQGSNQRWKENDDTDEECLKLKKDAPIEPLPRIDHSCIDYSSFRSQFLTPTDTPDGKAWRHQHVITCDPPMNPISSFSDPLFPPSLQTAIQSQGLTSPTPVQSQTLPAALSGNDVLVTASTGSGKTFAFLWPLAIHCDGRHCLPGEGPLGLILTPTRELAAQISKNATRSFQKMGLRTVCVTGGTGRWEITKELNKGCEIVVSTPGRLIDFVSTKKRGMKLTRVTMVVLDEADRMLEMGFESQVRSILETVRPDRQTLMFSATFKGRVEKSARTWLRNPVRISVGRTGTSSQHVDQHVFVLPSESAKLQWIIAMLPTFHQAHNTPLNTDKTLIFVNSRNRCDEIHLTLSSHPLVGKSGLRTQAIHGTKHQSDRNKALSDFKKNRLAGLIATDVAARGLDVPNVTTVVNFDPSKNMDGYVHRVGRAGRLKKKGGSEDFVKGTAYTLLTPKDKDFANLLLDAFRREGREVPQELLDLAKSSRYFGGGGGGGKRNSHGIGWQS